MAEQKKKVNTRLIIGIIIGIIILLILLLLFWHFRRTTIISGSPYDEAYNYTNHTNDLQNLPDYGNIDYNIPDAGVPAPEPTPAPDTGTPREYKTSNVLSEITFSRDATYAEPDYGDSWKYHVYIKVTGYIQEVDPAVPHLDMVLDRAYIFKDSNVKWEISGDELRESDNCRFDYSDEGSGDGPISSWSVDTGDVKLDVLPVEGWGSWALAYSENGFYTRTPELSLEGYMLFPMVEKDTTNHLTSHSICGDYYTPEDSVRTRNWVISPTLPLKLINLDINQKNHSGSLDSVEDSADTPEGASAMFEGSHLELPIDLPYDAPGNWHVSWNINLP